MIEVLIVSYGDPESLRPLLESIARQTALPSAVRVWHNGPGPVPALLDGAQVEGSGENLGFGEGVNRLFAKSRAPIVVVANPDLVLAPRCLEELARSLEESPEAVVAGGALLGSDGRVNAYGQKLTADLLGVNTDRGAALESLGASGDSRGDYLGPSGALFAVARDRWEARGLGQLFVRSFFLYLEDVALWIKLRRAGAGIVFCPRATAVHAWSSTTGQRSAQKLYYVERNRLWLLRALRGEGGALLRLPFTALRYASYLVAAPLGSRTSRNDPGLAGAFARALRDGLSAELPEELRGYLGAGSLERRFFATLREQLKNPVA